MSQICMMKNKTACKCHKVSKVVQFGSDMLCKKCPKKSLIMSQKCHRKYQKSVSQKVAIVSQNCPKIFKESVTKVLQKYHKSATKCITWGVEKCHKLSPAIFFKKKKKNVTRKLQKCHKKCLNWPIYLLLHLINAFT